MAATRIWIVDGHNMIFAIGGLQRLQVSDHREEARRGLVDRLRRFAQTRNQRVLVVFDGIDLPSNPDVIREPFLEVVYARRSDGAADDRIIHEARTRVEQGHHVTVVTNDVHTLAGKLPGGVHHLRVEEFWRKYIDRAVDRAGKRVEGDFSDVESEMLARAAVVEPAPVAPAATSASRVQGPAAAKDATAELIRRKREKGRLRQDRRLKRRVRR
ncbi:MAG: hypothetical protein AUI47_06135 [Acidobacteria bacterium 13_1_40CM_2_68_5]|nr:MAG: hypothetical protein AUI47_06135 [Acidobacteria bacterium 13_1_40CM_2_68_5]